MMSSETFYDVEYTSETDIISDSNIIPYSQYLSETQQETVQNSNSSAQQDVLILSMFEQITTQVTHCNTVNKALTTELDRYKEEIKDLKEKQNVENSFSGSNEQFDEIVRLKQNLFEHMQEKDCLMKTVSELKNDLKLEQNRNIEREIDLEKKIKQLDNIIFKRGQSAQTVHMMTKSKICYDHSSKQALGFEKPFCLKKARESMPKLLSKKEPLPQLSLRARGGLNIQRLAVEQTALGVRNFQVKMNQVLSENERLLAQAIDKDIVKTVVNLSVNANGENVTECQKCLELETELVKKKDFNLKKQDNTDCVGVNSNDCMSSDNVCVSNAVNVVKSRAKPKKNKPKKDIWKPTGKVFTQIGDIWKPTGKHGLVREVPKLKFEKDHLCSACALGKSSKKPHKPKSEDTNQEKLYLLHMDLCGPMRVASVSGKKYILVIVDDYSRFTWVKCLRSKDEAPAFIINFLKMIQVRLKETVRRIRTDNGTEFVNQTLREYYEKVGISHETSVARSP
ncbi:retrovirus-related pol polyprotein from transposon TNT 1-94 [Tanacetum coccineum]|uniref:Retrovirus-related pol polyprotein from transposon TNT 1-94 n=1 Tax=Tanacetum coccineum TaxID=301880 RepID=A0ABQ4YZA5_9ASTR